MTGPHDCDRYLGFDKDFLIFGCINPFCVHGPLGLPNHIKIPKNTKALSMKVVSHINRKLELSIHITKKWKTRKKGEFVKIQCDDNLESCKTTFNDLFKGEFP